MMKIVLCLSVLFAVSYVQGLSDCFSQAEIDKMKEVGKKCMTPASMASKEGKIELCKCMMKERGMMDGDKINYDNMKKITLDSIESEDKKKVIEAGMDKCKADNPDLGDTFLECQKELFKKECKGPM